MPLGGRRDPTKEKFWRRMLRRQAGSRFSVRSWCRRYGLREPTFYWWRTELARRDAVPRRRRPRRRKPAFVRVRIATASAPAESSNAEGRIEIVLPDQRRVQVIGRVDGERLGAVLAALEARPC